MSRGRFAPLTEAIRTDEKLFIGSGIIAIGLVFTLNPLYIDALLPYPTPGDSFDLTPLYFSELTVIGTLLLTIGVYSLFDETPLTGNRASGLAAVAVLLAIIYSYFGLRFIPHSFRVRPYAGWAILFIIVMLFPIGIVARHRDKGMIRRVLVWLFLGSLTFVILEVLGWMVVGRSPIEAAAYVGGRLLFGVFFLINADALLGVPMIGIILAVIPLVFGFLYPTRR